MHTNPSAFVFIALRWSFLFMEEWIEPGLN
ncbi:MAG: hypothetical protein ACJA1Z_000931 [Patiriisocius sp.]|jgi:hypothetical protein